MQEIQTDHPTTREDEDGYVHWALPKGLDVPADPLRLRLDFYGDAVTMTFFDGPVVTTKPVSAMDIVHALSRELEITSGLLPKNALWWTNTPKGAVVALWEEPRVRRVALQEEALETPDRFTIPFPGLIFLCQPGQAPWVYAAKKRPASPKDPVYKAPCFNVFDDGRVCPGTHKFPMDISEVPDSFWRSFFSPTGDHHERSKAYPRDLKKRWTSIKGKPEYPLKDLVKHGTVEDLMRMGVR